MRLSFVIVIALIIFLLSWLLNAALMLGLGYLSAAAGLKGNLIYVTNVLLTWIISPGLGSGIALYSTGSFFKGIDINLVYVGFTSIVIVLLLILFLGAIITNQKEMNFLEVAIFLLQALSILVGARIGFKFCKL